MSDSELIHVQKFVERGEYFLKQEQYQDAATNFKDAMNRMPNYVPAHTRYAVALAKQRKYLDAIKALESCRKSLPLRDDQNVEVLTLLGSICLIRQDYPAATYYIKAARKLDPVSSRIRMLLASCLMKSGKFAEGLDLMLENARAHKS